MDLTTRYCEQIDPNNPGGWTLVYQSPDIRYWECEVSPGMIVGRTEHIGSMQIIAGNQEALKQTRRWGEGQIAASIPLGEYFKSGMDLANKAKDVKFQRKWLNAHPQYKRMQGDI